MSRRMVTRKQLEEYYKHLGRPLPRSVAPRDTLGLSHPSGPFDPQPVRVDPRDPFPELKARPYDTFSFGPFEMKDVTAFQKFAEWDTMGVKYSWGTIIVSGASTQRQIRTNAEVRIIERMQGDPIITVEQAFGDLVYNRSAVDEAGGFGGTYASGTDFNEVGMGNFIYHIQQSEIPDVFEFWGREASRILAGSAPTFDFETDRSVTMSIRGRFYKS